MKRNNQKLLLTRRVVRNLDAAKGGQSFTDLPTLPTLTDIDLTDIFRPDPPMSAGDTECPPCPEPGSFIETLCQIQTECIPCETENIPRTSCCV